MKVRALARNILLGAMACVVCMSVLVGCGGTDKDDGRINIVCSVFPEYDWVRNIVGDSERISVSVLVSGSTDLHSYNASPMDMVKLKESDIVISAGGISDAWVVDALRTDAEGVEHIRLSEIDGMTLYEVTSESLDHVHEHDEHHEHGETDEHLWLSPKNAVTAVRYICERICAIDPDGAEKYRKNADAYIERLTGLDVRMTALSQTMDEDDTVVFADRFPFVYLFEDYGIDYYAAFEGCNTDAGWDTATTVRLAEKLGEVSAEYLFVTESSDERLANSVISAADNKDVRIAVLDSMQSAGGDGTGYVEIMRANVAVLEAVFGE